MNRRGRPPHPDILTPREWEVLAFLRGGLSNEQIAERLGITLRTAKFHVSEILSKLAVETREQAAAWQPEEAPARRWLAWPLIARIAGALVMVTAVAGLGLLAWGTLTTGNPLQGQEEPATVVEKALQAMDSSSSYRLEADLDLYHEDETWIIDFVRPDDYYVKSPEDDIETESGGFGKYAHEQVITGEFEFQRDCPDYPNDCAVWERIPRSGSGNVIIPGAWRDLMPLTALDMSQPREVFDGDASVIHLRGEANPPLALAETWRRELAKRGVTDGFGVTCENIGAEAQAPGTGGCRNTTFEEFIAREPGVREYQLHPATIDAYISRSDYRIQTIEIAAEASADTPEVSLRYAYSRFNEVTATPPTDFIPMTTSTRTP